MVGTPCRLLVGAACALSLLALPTTARADDTNDTTTATIRLSRAHLRALVVQGKGAEANAAIAEALSGDLSASERAALLELSAINEGWRRGVPRAMRATESEEGRPPPDWASALDLARREVRLGAYRSAAKRLDALVGDAPDLVEAARAIELREIARAADAQQAPAVEVPEARPETPAEKPAPRVKQHWYGWQTLLSDGAAIASATAIPAAGLATYFLGAPIVHLAHGHIEKAGASLGARVLFPFAGGVIGLGTFAILSGGDCKGDMCGLGAVLLGGIGVGLGAVAAVVTDAAAISYDRVRDKPPATTSAPRPRYKIAIQPTGGLRREGGFDVGIGGTW